MKIVIGVLIGVKIVISVLRRANRHKTVCLDGAYGDKNSCYDYYERYLYRWAKARIGIKRFSYDIV